LRQFRRAYDLEVNVASQNLTIEQRVGLLERALTTSALANINATASVITVLHKLPSFDSDALIQELTELKSLPTGADAEQYGVLIDMLIARLKAPKIGSR